MSEYASNVLCLDLVKPEIFLKSFDREILTVGYKNWPYYPVANFERPTWRLIFFAGYVKTSKISIYAPNLLLAYIKLCLNMLQKFLA